MAEPVVVPVTVEVNKSALQGLGEDVRRAREAAGGAGPSAAAGGAVPPAGAALSPGLLREVAALEAVMGRVALALERFGRGVADATPSGGGRGPGRRGPGPRGGGGRAAGGPVGRRGRYLSGQPSAQYLPQSLLAGAASTVGLGLGIGAVFAEMSAWLQRGKSFGHEAAIGTLRMGGGPADYARLDAAKRGVGFDTLVGPIDTVRGAGELGALGFGRAHLNERAALLGEVGLRAAGRPEAGMQMGAEAFRTFRTDRVTELLATIAEYGKKSGQNLGELLSQFGGVTRLFGQTQGQFRRTPEQLGQMAGVSRFLNELPEDAGKGAGGLSLLGQVQGFNESGLGFGMGLQAYTQATGRPVRNLHDLLAAKKWMRSPQGVMAGAAATAAQLGPDAATWFLTHGGRGQIEPMEALVAGLGRGGPGAMGLESLEQAKRQFGGDTAAMRDTFGGLDEAQRADLERTQVQEGTGWLGRGRQWVTRGLAAHPFLTLGAGIGIGRWGLNRLGGFGGLGRLFGRTPPGVGGPMAAAGEGAADMSGVDAVMAAYRARQAAAGVAGVAGAAGETAGAAGEAAGAVGLLGRLAPALRIGGKFLGAAGGALTAGVDVYQAAHGRGPNWFETAGGVVGAGLGAVGGFFGGGGVGAVPGALAGYGVGRGAASGLEWLFGGGSTRAPMAGAAEASLGPGVTLNVQGDVVVSGHTVHAAVGPGGRRAAASGPHALVDPHDPMFRRTAARYGLPPGLLEAVADVESSFDPHARSTTGTLGLMQITKPTGRRFGLHPEERTDPGREVETAGAILRSLLSEHHGDLRGALADYGDHKQADYAGRVLGKMGRYSGGGEPLAQAEHPELTINVRIHSDPNFPHHVAVDSDQGGVHVRQVG